MSKLKQRNKKWNSVCETFYGNLILSNAVIGWCILARLVWLGVDWSSKNCNKNFQNDSMKITVYGIHHKNGSIRVDLPSIRHRKYTLKQKHWFNVDNSISIQLLKSMKYQRVLYVVFPMSFRYRINVTYCTL